MKAIQATALFLFFLLVLPVTVYANSSWVWLTDARPYHLLPLAILLTLVIEIGALWNIARVENRWRSVCVVGLANLLSFCAPYLWELGNAGDMNYSATMALDRMPIYTVGLFYLLLTLIVEVPVVIELLAQDAKAGKKILRRVAIGSNLLTTLLVFGVERVLCYGQW